MDPIEVANIAGEIIKDRSKEIYDDGLKSATQEAGEALQAVVGLFNNLVLYPVKKANILFKYKLEQFEIDLKSKSEKIPKEKLTEPPLAIAGPTLEALKYTYDSKELREMFINLLVSSMNSDYSDIIHPSFVEIIKAMSPIDAQLFKNFTSGKKIPCARISIGFEDKIYIGAMPEIFIPDILSDRDPFVVSSSIKNLCRLGLLTHINSKIFNYNYELWKEHPYVVQQFNKYKDLEPTRDKKISITGEICYMNDFGIMFANSCID